MNARGWLSGPELNAARAERLALSRDTTPLVAPHFVARVIADAAPVGAPKPRRIETTLDAGLQRTVQGIIAAERASLDAHHAANVAVAILDNRTGEWLAWEGSGNYGDTANGGAIDGVTSPRQPGSALKPFTYAAAFERGVMAGPRARGRAVAVSDGGAGHPVHARAITTAGSAARMLARSALAGSENVPAVALASEIGVPAVARLLRRVGLSTLDHNAAHYGLGLTLGNAEVRLDELVAAYATFARGGEYRAPRAIQAIDGRAVPAGRRRAPHHDADGVLDHGHPVGR